MEPQTLREIIEWQPPHRSAFVSDGVLYERTRLLIYGKYKSLKSIAVMNLAMCLANGADWLGLTTKPCSVLYLQIEVPHDFLRKRLLKLISANTNGARPKLDTIKPLWLWTEPYMKLDAGSGLAQLEEKLNRLKPDVLVVDPLYKVLSGNILDPNSMRDFSDRMDILTDKHNLTLVVAHHSRKSAPGIVASSSLDDTWGSDDMLGAAVLSYWADTVLKITRKGGKKENEARVTFDVLRHAEESLDPVEVLFDRNTLTLTKKDVLKL